MIHVAYRHEAATTTRTDSTLSSRNKISADVFDACQHEDPFPPMSGYAGICKIDRSRPQTGEIGVTKDLEEQIIKSWGLFFAES